MSSARKVGGRKRYQKRAPQITSGQAWKKAGSDVWNVAKRAYRIAKGVASLINPEMKVLDTANVTQNISKDGTIVCLSGMAQGTTDITRIGNSILLKKLQAKFKASKDSTITEQVLRVIIFQDRNDNADTALTVAQVLQNVTTGYGVLTPLNKETATDRIKVLFDQYFVLNANSTNGFVSYFHKFLPPPNKPIKGIHATFNGANATDTAKGHLYMLAISDRSTDHYPTLDYYVRLRFIDN